MMATRTGVFMDYGALLMLRAMRDEARRTPAILMGGFDQGDAASLAWDRVRAYVRDEVAKKAFRETAGIDLSNGEIC